MVATYDNTLQTPRDRVRYALGDTNVVNALRQDETYNAVITDNGETLATAVLAEGLVTEYAQKPDSINLSGLGLSWRERVKAWAALAGRIRAELATTLAASGTGFVSRESYRVGDEAAAEYARPIWFSG